MEKDLKPCPFCGSPAEIDTLRSFRALSSGRVETSCAIYCTACDADMTICYSDVRDMPREDVAGLLFERWNKRAA